MTITDAPATRPSGEPLRIGPIEVDAPVVLAPMAGITNTAYRRLCREYGAGLYVSEMITSPRPRRAHARVDAAHHAPRVRDAALASSSTASTRTPSPRPSRCWSPRTAPTTSTSTSAAPCPRSRARAAARRCRGSSTCSATSSSGPCEAAGDVPLTVKMRKGIDDDHLTYLEAGRIAPRAPASPRVALHARTAARVLLRPRRLVGDRDAEGDRHRASRCSATATSGRPPTRCAWSTRPAATASSSAAAASAARGCSATSRPRSAARGSTAAADASARSPTASAGTPSCSSSSSTAKSTRLPRHPQARRLVLQGLPRRRRRAGRPRDGVESLAGDRRPARPRSTATSRTRATTPRGRAAVPAARSAPPLPDAGSRAATLDAPSVREVLAAAELRPQRRLTRRRRGSTTARPTPSAGCPKQHSNRRSDFARDRARLLHSSALRRLAAKTQVLSPTAGLDFARNRLTHSLEVAQVGRELATSLGLDPDVVDTACLAHDLGHPPFGHNGETRPERLGRRHRRLRGQRADPAAAHPARAEGLSAPTGRSLRPQPHPREPRRELQVPVAGGAGRPRSRRAHEVRLLRRRHATPSSGCARARPRRQRCIEAQVMDLSDDIAYSVHDFEDAVVDGLHRRRRASGRPRRPRATSSTRHARVGRRRAQPRRAHRGVRPAPRAAALADRVRRRPPRRRRALKNLTSQLIGRFAGAATQATRESLRRGSPSSGSARARRRPADDHRRDRGAQGHRRGLRDDAGRPPADLRATSASVLTDPRRRALRRRGDADLDPGFARRLARRGRRRRPHARRRRPGRQPHRPGARSPGTTASSAARPSSPRPTTAVGTRSAGVGRPRTRIVRWPA